MNGSESNALLKKLLESSKPYTPTLITETQTGEVITSEPIHKPFRRVSSLQSYPSPDSYKPVWKSQHSSSDTWNKIDAIEDRAATNTLYGVLVILFFSNSC